VDRAGCPRLTPRLLHLDLITIALGDSARKAFEELMPQGTYEYQSDFAKKHRAEGRAEGRAECVLAVLRARSLAVSPEQRERVLACSDLGVLGRWIEKAVVVASADELFAE